MKLITDQFGEIEFDNNIVIHFEDGLFGFEELKNYLILNEEEGLFYWLTSIDKPELVFPLFPISLLNENFETPADWQPFGIVKLDQNPGSVTINLKAPVFVNYEEKKGYQKIIDTDKNPVDYPLFVKNEE